MKRFLDSTWFRIILRTALFNFFLISSFLKSQSFNFESKITALDKNASDTFGYSVSNFANLLTVGSRLSDPDGVTNAGAAYVYRLEDNGSTALLSKITAPDKSASDYFGVSVSQSDYFSVVGANLADSNGVSNAGAAYMYRVESNGSVNYLTKITAPDKSASDDFGISVSQTGNFLAVGASGSDPNGVSNAGAAYVYRMENNGSVNFLSKITAPDMNASDKFGISVSQSGNLLVVGANESDPDGVSDAGAAYVYRVENNGSVNLLSKITAPDMNASDKFGISVSQSGNFLAVGAYLADPDGVSDAGAVYVYLIEDNGSVNYLSKITAPDKTASDNFGISVSQSGNLLAVGSELSDPGGVPGAGAVYIYRIEDNGSVIYLAKVTAPDKNSSDRFGNSVSQSQNLLVVGSKFEDPNGLTNAGAAYSFDYDEYSLVLNSNVGGAVVGSGTYDLNDSVTIIANADPGYHFSHWSGDLNISDINYTLSISSNLEINATFLLNSGDEDGDGITNFEELVTYSTNAFHVDSDSDGVGDKVEIISGTNPLNSSSVPVSSVTGGGSFGLVLKQDGSLCGTGENSLGQFGYGWGLDTSIFTKSIDSEVSKIVAGNNHTLFLKNDGSLWAMGGNSKGQLGDGSTTDRKIPVQIISSGVVKISAGQYTSAFIKIDGSLWGMGRNTCGQLADGTTNNRSSPYQILSSDVAEVAVGQDHLLYVKTDGSLWSVGRNHKGQLGDGTITDRLTPVQIRASGVSKVAASIEHSHFIDTNNSLWSMGGNSVGRLGDGTITRRTTPVQIMNSGIKKIVSGKAFSLFLDENGTLRGMGHNGKGQLGNGTTTDQWSPIIISTGVTDMGVGDSHSYFIDGNGTLWGMGETRDYRLGDGQNSVVRTSPVKIMSAAALNPKKVTTNTTIGGVIKGAGEFDFNSTATLTAVPKPGYLFSGWSGGLTGITNPSNLLMNQNYDVNATFTPDLGDSDGDGINNYAEALRTVASGSYHNLIVKADGSLWGIGRNRRGQLGDGTTVDQPAPVQIETNGTVVSVSASNEYSHFLRADGTLWGMGQNHVGQLGDGTFIDRSSPVLIDSNVSALTNSRHGSSAGYIKFDGSLWLMGYNDYGQLGDGSDTNANVPVKVFESGVISLAIGGAHSIFLKSDGSLWGTGRNSAGALGDGTTTDRWAPIQIRPNGVSQMAATYNASFYVDENGSRWAMGSNSKGNFGDGTIGGISTTPSQENLSGILNVKGGGWHSGYLDSNDSLWLMGYNNAGQLGDGTTTDRGVPFQIETNNVEDFSLGANSSLYIMKDGTVKGIGFNGYGQLGDGTTADQTSAIIIFTDAQMNPRTLTVNFGTGGDSVSGAGKKDFNSTVTLSATPSSGYIFSSWSGAVASSTANPTTVLMDNNYEVNATFIPDTADNDGDGLNNYSEIVTHSTNPDDSDSDDDNLTDLLETQFGLNPLVADSALMSYFSDLENDALLLGRTEGNLTGIEYVKANSGLYNLFTEIEKNASDLQAKNLAIQEANSTQVTNIIKHPNAYSFYTQEQKTDRLNLSYSNGLNDGKKIGFARKKAETRADLAREGVEILGAQEANSTKPHTYNWYYQPNFGWVWTSKEVYPHLYRKDAGSGKWYYFDPYSSRNESYYDQQTKKWETIE